VIRLSRGDVAFKKVRDQLQYCPTCGKKLVSAEGKLTIFQCPDRMHGSFAIVWSRHSERYEVAYIMKNRAIA
jgi:predicted RNA-binding Zn-ribbon protein involved in translation (DUF1610 family)